MKIKVGDNIKIINNKSAYIFDEYVGDVCVVQNIYKEFEDLAVDLVMKDGKKFRWSLDEVELYVDQRAEMLDLEESL